MILVTGGTGLAGSHLLLELTSQGKIVRALRRKSSNTDFLHHLFKAYARDPQGQMELIEWMEGDILDIFSLEDAMEGVTKVYHNAALVSFNPSERDLRERREMGAGNWMSTNRRRKRRGKQNQTYQTIVSQASGAEEYAQNVARDKAKQTAGSMFSNILGNVQTITETCRKK